MFQVTVYLMNIIISGLMVRPTCDIKSQIGQFSNQSFEETSSSGEALGAKIIDAFCVPELPPELNKILGRRQAHLAGNNAL